MDLETQKHKKLIEIHQSQSQTMTFWTCLSKVLFSNRCTKMNDGSEKRKHQFAFDLQSSCVFEEHIKCIYYYLFSL